MREIWIAILEIVLINVQSFKVLEKRGADGN